MCSISSADSSMWLMQDVPFSLEDRLKERGANFEKVYALSLLLHGCTL